MALVIKKVDNFAGIRGTPASDTVWDKLEWGFNAHQLKFIIEQGSTADLEISLNGIDVFMSLPIPETNMNSLIYDFLQTGLSRIFVRKVGAAIQISACGVK